MPAHCALEGFLLGEAARAVMRRRYATPSLTICGLDAGEMGPGVRLAVPQTARCKLEFRLVADQEPFAVLELLRRHLERNGLAHLQLGMLGHSTPYRSPLMDPFVQA